MGLLDVTVPTGDAPNAIDTCHRIMDNMKRYYEQLVDAKLSVASYIICYERAQESLGFAVNKFQQAYDEFNDNIEDEDKKPIHLKALTDAMNNSKKISAEITTKLSDLRAIHTKLGEYIQKTIQINNSATSSANTAAQLANPMQGTFYNGMRMH